jgi:hypothetical protein
VKADFDIRVDYMRKLHMHFSHMAPLSAHQITGDQMTTVVKLRNERTGKIKDVKVGFNWFFLLCSGIFGFPLFMEKIQKEGFIMLFLSGLNFLFVLDGSPKQVPIQIGILIVSIAMGVRGNGLIAKVHLENGWVWDDPEDEDTIFAKEKWALA